LSKHSIRVTEAGELIIEDQPTFDKDVRLMKGKRGFITLAEARPTRSNEQNRYLRAMYDRYLVPDYFDSADEAHLHYTTKFLSETDVLDLNDEQNFTEVLGKITGQARSQNGILSRKYHDNLVEIVWVRSTATLKTTEMEDFLLKFRTDAQTELGVTIPLPNQISY
jgi:hypothetical protein